MIHITLLVPIRYAYQVPLSNTQLTHGPQSILRPTHSFLFPRLIHVLERPIDPAPRVHIIQRHPDLPRGRCVLGIHAHLDFVRQPIK